MAKLTQERLKELLQYNPETGIFNRKITVTYNAIAGDISGCVNTRRYMEITIDGKTYLAHRLAWLYMEGYLPYGIDIDHKDQDKQNNKWDNLRLISRSCNMRNCGNNKRNTSGVRGVYWDKKNKKWKAQIKNNDKVKHLGRFSNFDNAVCARLAAEQYYKWDSCNKSSPAFQYVKKHINPKAK